MSDYNVRYGYLKLVKFPNEVGTVPTFKEEQMKLTKDETELLLETLKKYRKEKMIPKFEHTVSADKTTFIEHFEGVDYYYRPSIFDTIDLRHSSEPSDYTSWTFESIEKAYKTDRDYYVNVIPTHIYEKAKEIAINY